jgi:hypothetical protein
MAHQFIQEIASLPLHGTFTSMAALPREDVVRQGHTASQAAERVELASTARPRGRPREVCAHGTVSREGGRGNAS